RDATNEYNTWYRVELTVTDAGGLKNSVYKDIFPNLSNLTVQTDTPGSVFSIDGNLYSGYTHEEVVGVDHGVSVASPLLVGACTSLNLLTEMEISTRTGLSILKRMPARSRAASSGDRRRRELPTR